MEKKSKTTIVALLSLSLLLSGNIQLASAFDLDSISNYSISLSISPSIIEENPESNPHGYVYILNRNGIPITSDRDVEIKLTTDNAQIATVPEKVILPAKAGYAKFEILTHNPGVTDIVADLHGKLDFKEITVGHANEELPDNVILELNLPTTKMHVNTEMPFSVYIRTPEGEVIRAPYDIEINLEYEKNLATPNDDKLVIKKGENYAWGTIKTNEKTGSTFLRAIQPNNDIDAVKNINISSTFPTGLDIMVYPELIPAEIDRKIDVFVSLHDSAGNPTIAHENIPLEFFSDEQDYVGDDLDDKMKETKMVIKKGQFGYHFQLDLDLIGLIKNNIQIGVSAEGYGVAIDTFSTVGESISVENKRITDIGTLSSDRAIKGTDDKAVQWFGPEAIPSNATAYFAYQMAIAENDEDDPDEVQDYIDKIDEQFGDDYVPDSQKDLFDESSVSEKVQKFNIDYLAEDELYPIQANENYQSDGLIKLLSVVTSDNSLGIVSDPGRVKGSYSYGVAKIDTTQKSGPLDISVSLKGIGTETFRTNVVNSLELRDIELFSPTGKKTLLFERDGTFDLFLVALDGAKRAKTLDFDEKFLVTPTNTLIQIPKGNSFGLTTLQGASLSLNNGDIVKLDVSPIGENANTKLESEQNFDSQLSSKLLIELPTSDVNVENLNSNNKQGVGIIQLTDLQGNPIPASKDIKVKTTSSNKKVATVGDSVIINKGSSFVEFPFEILGQEGKTTFTASSKGLIGSGSRLTASSTASTLSVFSSGLVEPIPVNKEIQVTIFVDDDNADSVAGAKVFIYPNENATTSTDLVRTDSDGSATFGLTALSGPEISIDYKLQAEGYIDGDESMDILVDYEPSEGMSIADVELPQELVYVLIGGIAVVGVVVALFLKKSKEPIEDEEIWEEEDI